MKQVISALFIMLFMVFSLEGSSFARAGGGGRGGGGFSYGSRGSRTYSPPARPSPSPYSPPQAQGQNFAPKPPLAAPPPVNTAASGGFLRGLAGGIMGGILGSLLFSSLGHAGFGNTGGLFGGIGVFEVLIIGIGAFLLFRFLSARRQAAAQTYYGSQGQGYPGPQYQSQPEHPEYKGAYGEERPLLSGIMQYEPRFDEQGFKEEAQDIFFKVQSAWMMRDMDAMRPHLGPEIAGLMQEDISRLKREGRVNRLENIAIRDISITEAWVEEGRVLITMKILANVLDYVTDESGNVLEGSKSAPVKFMEYWTYVKPVGRGDWQLSAIQQGE